MTRFKKILATSSLVLMLTCIGLVSLLSHAQESIIFHPTKLALSYQFSFNQTFEEVFIQTNDSIKLHGVLFKADSSKGLIFYLHGNGGTVDSWGRVAPVYTQFGYDVFILDYRGYGKSEGEISSEKQFFNDTQLAYNQMKLSYNENKILVLGYSIGTGAAAWLASTNQPKHLILQAPYYSLTDLMNQLLPAVPTAVLEYKFDTYSYLQRTKSPVTIFHGTNDQVIYYESSKKLSAHLKPNDEVISLDKQGHNQMSDNSKYLTVIHEILSN
jgi:alpha-beta hydrolase superfamily lysophospholipase